MEFARDKGTVRPDKGKFLIDIWADGERYKIRHLPVVGGGWLPLLDEQTANSVLAIIRASIANGNTVLQAIAPYLRNAGKQFTVGFRYRKWLELRTQDAANGEITAKRLNELKGHLRRGHLKSVEDLSILEVKLSSLQAMKNGLLGNSDEDKDDEEDEGNQALAPKSVQHIMVDFRTFMRWLADNEDIPKVPKFPSVRVPEYVPYIPSGAQQDAMMDAIPWAQRGFFLARGYLGMRDEETARSVCEDYRLGETPGDDELMVRGKGGKNRWVPVDADVARWVREFRPVGPVVEAGQPLFTNPSTGGVWKSTSRRKVMVAAMEQAGFETRPNEALRHCYGTRTAARLLSEGQGETDAIRLIMRMMGHTSHASSTRYVKLAASTLRRALRPVDG